jgi:lipopolysaccharide biosynthesis regulator YciM
MSLARTITLSLISSLGSLLIGGCVTSSQKKTSQPKLPTDTLVVMQAGHSKPVMTSMARSTFVSIHNQSKDPLVKMQASMAAGETKTAITEAKNHLLNHPRNAAALNVLIAAYSLDKKYQLSLMYAQIYESFHRPSALSMNAHGLALLNQPNLTILDYRQAIKFFEKAFAAGAKEVAAGLNLGSVYLEIGDSLKAQDTFETVRGRCNDCHPALMGAAVASTRNRQFSQAKNLLTIILKLKPKDAEALYRLAIVQQNGFDDIKGAKKSLKSLLKVEQGTSTLARQAHVYLKRLESLDPSKLNSAASFTGNQGSKNVSFAIDADD